MAFLRDVNTLRSGDKWDDRLLLLIAQADIFQLFWSENASASKNVRREWQYALQLPAKEQRFIRPVYWVKPMPPPPPPLANLHFSYHPELAAKPAVGEE